MNDRYDYLYVLSDKCREMVINRVNEGGKNLYHSCMAVITNRIQNQTLPDKEKAYKDYFTSKSVLKHHLTDEEKKLVKELFDYCYDKQIKKYGYTQQRR